MRKYFHTILFLTSALQMIIIVNAMSSQQLTSAVLKVSYDGTFFHGWSASNDKNITIAGGGNRKRSGRSRRDRLRPSMRKGEIRSVEGSLKDALSKLYGNVPIDRIIVEGCSRTDKGVHSKNSCALIYCSLGDGPLSIPGKRTPHPTSPHDESFKEIPFNSDLQKMVHALNKMMPPDVRITNASPMPTQRPTILGRPFHPSLDSIQKTYRYMLSNGEIHDPIRSRNVWHVPYNKFDVNRARECADVLCGTHDFIAFRGAFRGNERGKVQDTVCTLFHISIHEEDNDNMNNDLSSICKNYCIEITGDRFLYKQVRFLVGTIVQYASNDQIKIEAIVEILEAKKWYESSTTCLEVDENLSFPRFCAPSHGLCLTTVEYADDWNFDWILPNQN